jgi:hypothetical protein
VAWLKSRNPFRPCTRRGVAIGRGWAETKDEAGARRPGTPNDFVRIEVEAALRRDIPMGAALIGGAPMPRAEQLPESMHPLLRRNASPVALQLRL